MVQPQLQVHDFSTCASPVRMHDYVPVQWLSLSSVGAHGYELLELTFAGPHCYELAMEFAWAYAVVMWSCGVATAILIVVVLSWLAGWWLEWPLSLAAAGLARAVFRMVVMRGRRSFGEIRYNHCWPVRVTQPRMCSKIFHSPMISRISSNIEARQLDRHLSTCSSSSATTCTASDRAASLEVANCQ